MNKDLKPLIKHLSEFEERRYKDEKEFNVYFDEEGYDNVDDEDGFFDAESYSPSEILFKCDPEAYRQKLEKWKRQSLEKAFEPTLSLLKEERQKKRVMPLIEVLRKQRVTPFIGAGLSIPCGMKTWADLLRDIGGKTAGLRKVKLEKMLEEYKYLEAAEMIDTCSTANLTEYLIDFLNVDEEDIQGGVLHLPDIASQCIITSNFDNIIETVFLNRALPFKQGYMQGTQTNRFFQHLVAGNRCLLKLHGDHDDSSTHVFTASQYKAAYGEEGNIDFTRPLPKALRQIFISSSLLFLGCSLEMDRTLELFQAVIDSDQYHIPRHYALLEEPADGSVKEKDDALLKLGISVIWYPNRGFEHVENFTQFLAEHVKDPDFNLI